jgi:shikimate kinase
VRFDGVYIPRMTAFLEAAPGKTIRGVDLLVAQGTDQLRLFGVAKPDVEKMRAAAEGALDRMERRVVLVGMRGAGKTSVGEALAAATERPLLDTDRMVEQRAGRKVAEIFAAFGEAAFRLMEKDAVAVALRGTGTVVALGGGAVQHLVAPQGQAAQGQPDKAPGAPPGTAVVWLRAPRDVLVERIRASGRPSLGGRPAEEEIGELLAAREPLYARVATLTVDTGDRAPGEAAAEIAEALGL